MTQVVTGDAVVLDVQVAQLPVRAVAALIDIAVMAVATLLGMLLVALTMSQIDEAWVAGLMILLAVLVPVLYPTIFETTTRGRSLGKLAMGLRVVSVDGGPERFAQALFRALASVVEIWMLFGSPAVICSLLSPQGRRIGDIFAGTLVISERGLSLSPPPIMPPQLAGWAASLQLSGLPPEQAELARHFLARAPDLDPARRDEMAYRIATDVVARIAPPPPPGAPPPLVLAAVLAERHRRALARLQPPAPAEPAWPTPQPAAVPMPPSAGHSPTGWSGAPVPGAPRPARAAGTPPDAGLVPPG